MDSYRQFLARAIVHRFDLDTAQVDIVGGTAVATCPFTMEYEIAGRRWSSIDRDLLVLNRMDDHWLIVWRTMLPGEEEEITTTGFR